MRKIQDKYWPYLIYLALTAVTIAVFWQVNTFDFINYDDNKYVSKNEHISSGLTSKNIIWVFTEEHVGNWHPLTGLSHILDCQLFGFKPGLHHLVNLLFHIANTVLLFTVLRRMTAAIWQSVFVAALFALHPLHVESVAWISERKDVLSTLFWLLTMTAYLSYVKNPKAGNYILTLILFALGLMSKPMLVTLPLVLLLLDYWPLSRIELKNTPQILHLVREKIPFFALSLISSIITFTVQKGSGAVQQIELYPVTLRLTNAVVSYAKYITKMIWPERLAILYPHPGGNLPNWQVLTAAVTLLCITIAVIRFAKKYKYLFVGWFWYLGTLVPVIGLVQVGRQAMADRYTYVPLIGLFIIVAWAANDLLINWKYRKPVLTALSVTAVMILSICSWFQINRWRNSQTLFEHTLKVTTGNYMIYNNLGFTLLEQNKLDEAINLFQHALQIKPDHVEAYNNLGMAYGKLGRKDEEMQAYKQALKLGSGHAETYHNLGITLSKQGKYYEAIDAFKQAIKINPELLQAYYELGSACGKIGRLQEEMDAYCNAIRIKPDYYQAYTNLGVIYSQFGRFEEAINNYLQAVKIKPDYADAYNNLGVAYGQLGRFRESIQAFQQAVQLKPDLAEAHCGLGISYMMAGDKNAALAEYEILKKLDKTQADKLFSVISGK